MSYGGPMLGRFTVRPSNDGDGTYGVWDGAVNGWRASGLVDAATAELMKSDLDLQYNAHGPRPAGDVRRADPVEPVLFAVGWEPGELDAWVREKGQWLGRVRGHDGHIQWIPAADLRRGGEDAP
ncbi:hypothetical protein GCM10027269_71670 [Kribbella endophytica]